MKGVPGLTRRSNKRFAAGSCLYHDGGTWEAVRDTDELPHPLALDWVIRANGIAEFSATLDPDCRKLTIAYRLTDGTENCQSAPIPAWVYRGVWRRHEQYRAGDWITHDGALWLAMRDDPGVPAEGNGWRLVVHKGRAGRNGRDCQCCGPSGG
ncbi:hypothetical protein [Cupriavidus taiwanensis]